MKPAHHHSASDESELNHPKSMAAGTGGEISRAASSCRVLHHLYKTWWERAGAPSQLQWPGWEDEPEDGWMDRNLQRCLRHRVKSSDSTTAQSLLSFINKSYFVTTLAEIVILQVTSKTINNLKNHLKTTRTTRTTWKTTRTSDSFLLTTGVTLRISRDFTGG